MSFDDNQFSVVLDKGTFDALMSNKSQQVIYSFMHLNISIDYLGPVGYQSNARTNRSCFTFNRSIYLHNTRSETYSSTYFTIFLR